MKNKYNCNYQKTNKLIYVFRFILILLPAFALAQNCNTNLDVKKNRTFKSISSMNGNKTIFAMSIENTSTKMQTYSVTAVKSASDCSNKTLRRQRNEANVDVLVSFSDNLKNVSVYPGQVTDFTVTITAPKGTEMNKWGCTKIIAATKDCAEADSVILSTYIATNQE